MVVINRYLIASLFEGRKDHPHLNELVEVLRGSWGPLSSANYLCMTTFITAFLSPVSSCPTPSFARTCRHLADFFNASTLFSKSQWGRF